MCSVINCAYDNSTIILIGDVYCPNTKCLGKFCQHKKTFQSLGRSDYQCPQCTSVCQVRNIPFEDQINSFFLSLGPVVYISEESPKSIEDVIGDVFCPGKYCLNRGKCKSVGGYVTTPRSIYGCDNCGAWLFVHKVPFKIQEHVKTTKTDKRRFSLLKKMLHDKQLFNKVPFQSTNYRKKEFCVENKVRETIGDVYCPTYRNEKCVYLSINETTSFYDCKKCKACCNVLNIPFRDQKTDNYVVWRWWNTLLCMKDESRLRKRKIISSFEEISPPITTKHIRACPKKGQIESKYEINVFVSYWLMIWAT